MSNNIPLSVSIIEFYHCKSIIKIYVFVPQRSLLHRNMERGERVVGGCAWFYAKCTRSCSCTTKACHTKNMTKLQHTVVKSTIKKNQGDHNR